MILGQRVLGARDMLEIIRKERCGGGVRVGEHPGGVAMVWCVNLRLTPLEEIEVEKIDSSDLALARYSTEQDEEKEG